jgi:hypothetical protein
MSFDNYPHEYDPTAFEIDDFRDLIGSCWIYHGLCNRMNWSVTHRDDGVTQVEIAPPFQIVYGGPEDGKKVWTPFQFHVLDFLNDADVGEVEECGVMTYSLQDNHEPFFLIVGSYRGKKFAMRIHLEPDPTTEPLELIDRIRNEVRAIPGESS